MVKISLIEKKEKNLFVKWSDGEKSNFNYLWLRDNCPTAHDKNSKHRMFNILYFPLDIEAKKFKINAVEDTDGLEVTHKAVEDLFPNGFLVVQDGRNLPSNQNFKIVNMEEVLKKKLSLLGLIN